MLGSALHGREAGAAQAGRDGRQDTVPGYGGAGNKTHPQRRDGAYVVCFLIIAIILGTNFMVNNITTINMLILVE